jgi:predicted MPP superfamily phosphohydrolase
MALIVQISDTHFGAEQPAVVDALLRLVHEQGPTLAILSGDITQRARSTQFEAARQFVDLLKMPACIAIPGNHDIPLFDLATRFFRPYAKFQKAFGDNLEPVYGNDELLVITVNTTRPYRHVDGEVSQEQIDRVARMLQAAMPAQLRIVVTHQPVCVTREEDRENLLHGHENAVAAWVNAGVDIIMGGHIHLPYVCQLQTERSNCRRAWTVQAGTAVSTRTRHEAGNSVNFIRYESGRPAEIKVERWDYQSASQAFKLAATHELERHITHGS